MDHSTIEATCNGPCRKRFRLGAVNMDHEAANLPLSSDRTPGQKWLCPRCRQAQPSSDLPPELWATIFRNLDSEALLSVRSTCRRWRDIVDQNQSLRKKLCIYFEPGVTMRERYKPKNLFPASQASLISTKIICNEAWWPRFAGGLTELSLERCTLAVPVLLGMLKEAPNLARLILSNIKYTSAEEIDADFRLEKLEELGCRPVLDAFRNIFPSVKKLRLGYKMNHAGQVIVCRLLQSVQATVQELDCHFTPFVLEQMFNMDRLHLTTLKFWGESDLAVQLSRFQTTIEDLWIVRSASKQDLCQIGRNLTKLKKVRIIYESETEFEEPLFLEVMPQLEFLSLSGVDDRQYLNLERFKGANLTDLHLSTCFIDHAGLRICLDYCSKLNGLEIRNCFLISWFDVFGGFPSLRRLTLSDNEVENDDIGSTEKLANLQVLELDSCDSGLLDGLLSRCPRIEKLFLSNFDDDISEYLDQFPLLKELRMVNCDTADEIKELVGVSHPNLVVYIDYD